MTLCITVAVLFADNVFSGTLGTLLLIALSGVIYVSAVFTLKVFTKSELTMLPIAQK